MTRKAGDIYGQIDALLGKRSSEILNDRVNQSDDFPMLTEVILDQPINSWQGTDRRRSNAISNGRRLTDRRLVPRRVSDSIDGDSANNALLSEEIATRLIDNHIASLLHKQQDELLETLKKVLSEQLSNGTRDI